MVCNKYSNWKDASDPVLGCKNREDWAEFEVINIHQLQFVTITFPTAGEASLIFDNFEAKILQG